MKICGMAFYILTDSQETEKPPKSARELQKKILAFPHNLKAISESTTTSELCQICSVGTQDVKTIARR